MYLENRLKLPSIISIACPSIGEVQGITMRVLSTPASRKKHGLVVELKSNNLKYIGNALNQQYSTGGVAKKATKRKRANHDPSDTNDTPKHDYDHAPTDEERGSDSFVDDGKIVQPEISALDVDGQGSNVDNVLSPCDYQPRNRLLEMLGAKAAPRF